MRDFSIEAEVHCPFCGEAITIFVDPSVERQEYVEDCSVCCRPISFQASCHDGELSGIHAERGA